MSDRSGLSPHAFQSYQQALAWLYSLQRFGIKLGLETTHRLLDELKVNLSDSRLIHVAGTNGKGSVCAMIEAIGRDGGLTTGLFISPHLVTFRERIRVNGELISESDVTNGLSRIRDLISGWDHCPTFFEVTTALALDYFSRQQPGLVILETGLGGRLDSTNAMPASVSVITAIGLDHQKWLGQTLPEIASEKAGIIKANTPVISHPQPPEAEEVIQSRAKECNAELIVVTHPYQRSPLNLSGSYQKLNAAVAVAALRAGGFTFPDGVVARALASVEWPARFQRWDDRTIIDGAHNPAAAAGLAQTWREMFPGKRATVVLAILSDKDIAGILGALAPIAAEFILPKIRSERAIDPHDLAKIVGSITPELHYSIAPSVAAALDLARARLGPILITGSLHFAGEALALLRGEPAAFEECVQ